MTPEAASRDPDGVIAGNAPPLILDEVRPGCPPGDQAGCGPDPAGGAEDEERLGETYFCGRRVASPSVQD